MNVKNRKEKMKEKEESVSSDDDSKRETGEKSVLLKDERVTLVALEDKHKSWSMELYNNPNIIRAVLTSVSSASEWFDFLRGINSFVITYDEKFLGICALEVYFLRGIPQNGELIIILDEGEARKNGYACEAVSLMRDIGFQELGLNSIRVEILASNEDSINLFKKAGFRQWGWDPRTVVYSNGDTDDVVCFSILREKGETAARNF